MEEKVEPEKTNIEVKVAEKPAALPDPAADSPKTEEPVADTVAASQDTEKPTEAPEPPKTETADTEKVVEAPAPEVVSATAPAAPLVPPEHRPPITGFARPPRHRKRLALIIVVAVLIIAAGAAAGFMLANRKPAKPKPVATAVKKPQAVQPVKSAATVSQAQLLTKFTTPTTGETWLATPKKVGNLGYAVDYGMGNGVTYYQVGAHGTSTIYMSTTPTEGGDEPILFEKDANGSVRAIEHPSSSFQYSAAEDSGRAGALAKNVSADTTTHYDSLSMPSSFSLGNGESVMVGKDASDIGTGLTSDASTGSTKQIVVHAYGQSKLVKAEHQYTDTGLTAINYEMDLPSGTQADLTYTPIGTDLAKYTWSNGVSVPEGASSTSATNSTISGIVRGCGSAADSVSWDYQAKDSDFVAAGKTADGKTVYAFASDSDPIVQKAYSEYKDDFTGQSDVTVVSESDFLKNHAIVAYKDASGEWLVYTRDQYAAVGGCAKPVVYLYPAHAENVNVRLGAKMAKSDPQYDPNTGWNVYAQPNGQLSVGGKAYGSLFWEGTGSGFYPAVTSGTVVKRAAALGTIRAQLAQQGLKPNEINDFVAYWQSKIPNEPYIRLTWFNTAEMNELAPLTVTPKPDTLIRVFLDMDGFIVPPKLPAQHLSSVPRNGFTVVEWGGLSQSALQ